MSEDLNLKGKPDLVKFCSNCDLGIVGCARHIILQGPLDNTEIIDMFNALENLEGGAWHIPPQKVTLI